MSLKRLNVEKHTDFLFFRKPFRADIVTLSLAQSCRYYLGKCGYLECDYFVYVQYQVIKIDK